MKVKCENCGAEIQLRYDYSSSRHYKKVYGCFRYYTTVRIATPNFYSEPERI